ncbi:hypothetical protein L6R52_12570 [Myxococcota bacterium]|nr:hypothetical protein [Myxococcota bacterium]
MRVLNLLLPLTLVGALAAGCKTTSPQPVAAPAEQAPRPTQFAGRSLPQPTNLNEEVRDALKRTMNAHGDDMTLLLWSILFLDLDSAGEWAKAIAARPPLTPKDDVKLGRIPPQILVLGSQLNEQAMRMAEMSRSPERDSEAFAQAFGELAQTCVRCHAVYLYDKAQDGEKPAETPAK